jgi:hypothetical protein
MREAYQIEELYRSARQYFFLKLFIRAKKAVSRRKSLRSSPAIIEALFDNRALLTEALFKVKRLWSPSRSGSGKSDLFRKHLILRNYLLFREMEAMMTLSSARGPPPGFRLKVYPRAGRGRGWEAHEIWPRQSWKELRKRASNR